MHFCGGLGRACDGADVGKGLDAQQSDEDGAVVKVVEVGAEPVAYSQLGAGSHAGSQVENGVRWGMYLGTDAATPLQHGLHQQRVGTFTAVSQVVGLPVLITHRNLK